MKTLILAIIMLLATALQAQTTYKIVTSTQMEYSKPDTAWMRQETKHVQMEAYMIDNIISISDKIHSRYTITKRSPTIINREGYHVTCWDAYDEAGKSCVIRLDARREDDTAILSVLYLQDKWGIAYDMLVL